MWLGVVSGKTGRCRHHVAVKKVGGIGEGENVMRVESGLEELRRKAMWCRNVCRFHGVVKVDGCLGLVMDECSGSVETEMRSNEGRLTLEQILRCVFVALLIMCLLEFMILSFMFKKCTFALRIDIRVYKSYPI
ncbi:putative non-specific serine/threonine protein kinase [Helianthus annuus]|nr:putative non-specific serine/threonine protein kinase [Helianthus annuus]